MSKAKRIFLTAAAMVLVPVLSNSAEFEITEFRFAGRFRTKPPARPGVETTKPLRARA